MHLGKDIRYAFRQLHRSPGFTITAVLTLALGIGATTAIFSLIYITMLKPLPVRRPAELYKVGRDSTCCAASELLGDWSMFSNELYETLRDHTQGFQGTLAAFQSGQTPLLVHRQGDPQAAVALLGKLVSGNYFSVLEAPVAMGRGLTPADDRRGASPVTVISDRMWQRRFGRDPHIIGETLLMNGTAVTIVGVTAPEFLGETIYADMPELWIPLHQEENFVHEGSLGPRPDRYWLDIIGRIAPGAEHAQIDAQLNTELKQWLHSRSAEMQPDERSAIDRQHTEIASAEPGINIIGLYYSESLKLLMAAAAFVMLIVCANVANLLLVRALAHSQQTSVRMALGASRRQLLQQAIVSSIVLALLGCVGAIGVAYALSNSVVALAFRGIDFVPITARPSPAMLGFAFVTAVVTAVLFGAGPAWISTRNNLASVLRAATRTTRSSGTASQRALVILQAALSVVLLCAAGLLMRSLSKTQQQDFGFQTKDRYVIGIDPALAGYRSAQTNLLYQRLTEGLMAIPGAKRVGIASYAPMSGESRQTYTYFPGQPNPSIDSIWGLGVWNRVNPEYFDAIGAKLREGRVFTDADDAQSRKVAIVSEGFARRFLKGNALGQHFGIDPELRSQFEIIGVVRDVKYRFPNEPVPPLYFLPFRQTTQVFNPSRQGWEAQSHFAGNIILELNGSDRPSAEAAIRKALRDVDANLPITSYYTFKELQSYGFIEDELMSRLCGLFAFIALVLAAIGIYGVTAYSVQRRTGEIGIRMALGASRLRILREVLLQSLLSCGIGLVVGIPLAYLAGRLLADRLFGVGSFDLPVVTVAVLLLSLSAAAAALLPARRAASIEPMQALRSE
ncbi:MAG TPA: ABC transporter permease [Acidobacteriaceae bacterium]|nr:ABC transporter permease [Acidobacteriaceae bacterium]